MPVSAAAVTRCLPPVPLFRWWATTRDTWAIRPRPADGCPVRPGSSGMRSRNCAGNSSGPPRMSRTTRSEARRWHGDWGAAEALLTDAISMSQGVFQARHALAATDVPAACAHLETALAAFVHAGIPYRAAQTRLLLAQVLGHGDREVAGAEARAALSAFEDLGAGRDADAAAALMRDLGIKAARTGPKNVGRLTSREQEVLALLGEGLSNPEIAGRLFLSRKTVEHHVARILSKLGLRGRAEAAALAARGAP